MATCSRHFHNAVKDGPSPAEYIILMKSLPLNLTWKGLETVLLMISTSVGFATHHPTVATYCNMLHALQVCPRISPKMAKAFQDAYELKFPPKLGRPWTSYRLDLEQHGGFEDFAAALGPTDPALWEVSFWDVPRSLLACATFDFATWAQQRARAADELPTTDEEADAEEEASNE